jgi:lactoylglutathione lyase
MKFGYAITYVSDVARTVAFWRAAFGIEARFVVPTGDYAELQTGATAIAFASHDLGRANLPEGYAPADASALPQGIELALVTDDVATATERALAAGATLLKAPAKKTWGQTVAYVRTPDGNLIELCSPMVA